MTQEAGLIAFSHVRVSSRVTEQAVDLCNRFFLLSFEESCLLSVVAYGNWPGVDVFCESRSPYPLTMSCGDLLHTALKGLP
jgi:hypothetical protein